MTEKAKSRPTHNAFMVEGEGKTAKWNEIGAMWPNKSGHGFTLILKAMPINGRVVILERDTKDGAGQ
jgi:hypothetical protein